jgi:hypothetical protein
MFFRKLSRQASVARSLKNGGAITPAKSALPAMAIMRGFRRLPEDLNVHCAIDAIWTKRKKRETERDDAKLLMLLGAISAGALHYEILLGSLNGRNFIAPMIC